MKVNWDDDIPNIWENKKWQPNHQPVKLFKPLDIETDHSLHNSWTSPTCQLWPHEASVATVTSSCFYLTTVCQRGETEQKQLHRYLLSVGYEMIANFESTFYPSTNPSARSTQWLLGSSCPFLFMVEPCEIIKLMLGFSWSQHFRSLNLMKTPALRGSPSLFIIFIQTWRFPASHRATTPVLIQLSEWKYFPIHHPASLGDWDFRWDQHQWYQWISMTMTGTSFCHWWISCFCLIFLNQPAIWIPMTIPQSSLARTLGPSHVLRPSRAFWTPRERPARRHQTAWQRTAPDCPLNEKHRRAAAVASYLLTDKPSIHVIYIYICIYTYVYIYMYS